MGRLLYVLHSACSLLTISALLWRGISPVESSSKGSGVLKIEGNNRKPEGFGIHAVSGYLSSLNKQPNDEEIQGWMKPKAFKYPFAKPEIRKYMKEFFKHFWEDWSTWIRIYKEPESIINHNVDVFAWACLAIRLLVRSRSEDFKHVRNNIKAIFDHTSRQSIDLAIIDCPLEFPGGIVPTKIAKKHPSYKDQESYPTSIDYAKETFVLLLEGRIDGSYLEYQPMDLLFVVENGKPFNFSIDRPSTSEKTTSLNRRLFKGSESSSSSSTSRKSLWSSGIEPNERSEIDINEETYGYLTSMRIYKACKRRNIALWNIPDALEYGFTLPQNKDFLWDHYGKSYARLSSWRRLYEMSDTVKEHNLESYAQACAEIRNHVGSEQDPQLLEKYENILANAIPLIDVAVFDCHLMFEYGNEIRTKIAKRDRIYIGSTCKDGFPNEEFFVLVRKSEFDRRNYAPMDVVSLEEGKRNMNVPRPLKTTPIDPFHTKGKNVSQG